MANVKFVSKKIKKVRWQPVAKHSLQKSVIFCSGSWDDPDNNIAMWKVVSPQADPMDFDNINVLETPQGEPDLLCEVPHCGDVLDMEFINEELLLVSSSTGSLNLFRFHSNSKTIKKFHEWNHLHNFGNGAKAACTGITVSDDESIVSVGEDGKINILNLKQRNNIRTLNKQDSCNLNAVKFLTHQEITTVNSTGQLKVWDLREANSHAARTFLLAGDRVPLHCIDKHPTQPHIVATGGQNGMLSVWDMRQDKFPVTLLDAHSADMWEVKFHPTHPDNLFSCSEDCQVWHWDGTGMNKGQAGFQSVSMSLSKQVNQNYTSPWLVSDAAKHNLDITNLLSCNTMPANSIDILDNTLVCGTDGEAIYVQHNIIIR